MGQTLITDRRTSGFSYETLDRLGKGGMAEVFLARQESMTGLSRLVVIKKILPQLSQMHDMTQMLEDEARVTFQLTHPNIVQVHDVGQEEGQYFIVMEFVDGCDLATLARIERHRHSRIPLRLTLRVVSEAAMGLDYAHRQVGMDGRPLNIVHRDVSPHNIMCSREGAVKVTDFGISKFVGKHQLTQVGVVKGKVQYMSPEQYSSAAVDCRSDVFSLGVVLYQLTVGRLPRVTESGQVAIKRVIEGNIPRPGQIRPDYPEELEAIVMRALAHNPEERYQDAASLRDDLLDFAREHDLLAFPKELSSYVNAMAPPRSLVVREQSVLSAVAPGQTGPHREAPRPAAGQGRDLSAGVARKHSDGRPRTEVASRVGQAPFAAGGTEEISRAARDTPGRGLPSGAVARPGEQLVPPPGETGPVPRPARQEAPEDETDRTSPERPALRRETGPHPRRRHQTEPAPQTRTVTPVTRETTDHVFHRRSAVGLWVGGAALVLALASVIYMVAARSQVTPLPPKRASLGAGVINVLSNPSSASVSIDGAQRCPSTPCQIAGLPLGRELLLTLRAREHSLWMQRLVLTFNEPKLLLRADLTPLSGHRSKAPVKKGSAAPMPGKSAEAPADGSPGHPRATAGGSSRPRPRGGHASRPKNMVEIPSGSDRSLLVVDVRPWAEVWLDGKKVGHTPLQLDLPPGTHRIELKNKEQGYHKVHSLRVRKGKKIKLIDTIPPKT